MEGFYSNLLANHLNILSSLVAPGKSNEEGRSCFAGFVRH